LDESKGEETAFAEALQEAKNALARAQGRVSTGYSGEEQLLNTARTIRQMADDLVTIMESRAASQSGITRRVSR
jgi:hypothetical protein